MIITIYGMTEREVCISEKKVYLIDFFKYGSRLAVRDNESKSVRKKKIQYFTISTDGTSDVSEQLIIWLY